MTRWPIFCGCLLLISCLTRRQDALVTQNAVDEFHQLLRAHQDQQIFARATPEFRKLMNLETTQALFTRVRKRLGAPAFSQPTRIQVNHMPGGTFILAQFRTRFEKAEAQENFTWRIQDGKARLVGYSVNSPLLLVD
jgi:hypothetical protein